MKKAIFGVAIVAIFTAGFECGGNFVQNRIAKQLKDKTPLIANAIASVYEKVMLENLSKEEATSILQDELDFLKIVME
jgi:uncharacterized protein YneF (UPF0154 family)